MSRLATATSVEIRSTCPGFSNFRFVEEQFSGSFPIRRLFSQARSRDYQTLVVEEVPAEGPVADENQELEDLFPGFRMKRLVRLSFWRSAFGTANELEAQESQGCLGFALLKLDSCPADADGEPVLRWHVFESVIRPYEHPHNFVPCARLVGFRSGASLFAVPGVIYCQQNRLNKSCAHVALRSICTAYLDDSDLPFSKINQIAFAGDRMTPWRGLSPDQISAVLSQLDIPNYSIYYPGTRPEKKMRSRLPYQKLLYSGVETGAGALLAFSLSGPRATEEGHIVPVFGHTFNEDAWAPNASSAYFKIGRRIRYVPSEAWMSSFIGHDDNFGSNLCIPYSFISPKQAVYAVTLRPREFVNPPFVVEAWAAKVFYSLLPQVMEAPNIWLKRLEAYVRAQKLILRTTPSSAADYSDHISGLVDWDGKSETRPFIIEAIRHHFPEKLWVIEVSIPDLFSTNLRKLGELVLRGDILISNTDQYRQFVMARLPGVYAFFDELDGRKHPNFSLIPNPIESHTKLLTKRPQ